MIGNSSIRLLITSGDGPAECRQAVAHVTDEIIAEAREHSIDFEITHPKKAGKFGPPSTIISLHGEIGIELSKQWLGTILWIAQSKVRPNHRRRNWFIAVFGLPFEELRKPTIEAAEVRFEAFKAGGPGGQHQNTTDSAVRATHLPSGRSVVVRDQRSQHRNKKEAIIRLEQLLDTERNISSSVLKALENGLHSQLERGNPKRIFKGNKFAEV
jgi:peptide chain release factor